MAKQILAVFTFVSGCAIVFLASSIPSYFTTVDKYVVAAAGNDGKSFKDVALLSLDNAQVSTALIFAKCMVDANSVEKPAREILAENPIWSLSGGDCPFYEAFCSTLSLPKGDFIPVFDVLASRENRNKLVEFLSQTKNAFVRKILDLRSLNTTMLPPAYTSAGAPFEASLLSLALLAQSGNIDSAFLLELSEMVSSLADSRIQEDFEKCTIGILALIKNLDYSALSAVFKRFKSPGEVFAFAELFASQKDEYFRACAYAAAIMAFDVRSCVDYLTGADIRRWGNLSYALEHGKGAVDFLLKSNKPIYENSKVSQYIDSYCAPIKILLAPLCVECPISALVIKSILMLLGFSMMSAGVLRLMRFRRSTIFFTLRSMLVGAVLAVIYWSMMEPEAFLVKIQNSTSTEIRIAFDKIKSNMIGDKDMLFSIDTDSATLAAIALFFVMQLIVYIACLVRINVIKRTRASATLKLKLLENEDNLFDLGLYIGLSGTVASLILLTFGVITASLMAGYTSTLFGILFTAVVKIVHLRKFKRKLLIESSNEQNS